MKQFQSFCQGCTQCPECIVGCLRILVCFPETYLGHLDVPVTELVPQEIINLLYGDSKFVFIHVVCYITDHGVEFGKDPFVLEAEIIKVCRFGDCLAFQVHHDET